MAKKYSFPELECANCAYYQCTGTDLCGTRYCQGFPKKRKPKRFSSSDPKYRAPKWCPRRLSTPVCRIYGFANAQSEYMDILIRERFDSKQDRYISPYAHHYRLRLETPLNMKAKGFYESANHGDLDDFFEKSCLQLGEVIEIDDGLKPYYFYCLNWSRIVPMLYFDRSSIQKTETQSSVSLTEKEV